MLWFPVSSKAKVPPRLYQQRSIQLFTLFSDFIYWAQETDASYYLVVRQKGDPVLFDEPISPVETLLSINTLPYTDKYASTVVSPTESFYVSILVFPVMFIGYNQHY
jgi:hypothetical protein